MADLVVPNGAGIVLMHMQGTPRTMQQAPHYDDVVGEVSEFFEERIRFAMAHGILRRQIILDPGLGFGKLLVHNLALIAQFHRFVHLECPLLVGVSRKGFLGQLVDRPVQERQWATAAAVAIAVDRGAGHPSRPRREGDERCGSGGGGNWSTDGSFHESTTCVNCSAPTGFEGLPTSIR